VQPFHTSKPLSFRKILFATDFRECSAAVVPYVVALAQRCNSHVFVTHVVSPALAAFSKNEQHLHSAGVPARIDLPADYLSGIPHEFLIRDGEVAPTLCRLARGYDPDLILIGMNAPRRVTARLGSVAEQTIRTAPCPVLTVGPAPRLSRWMPRDRRITLSCLAQNEDSPTTKPPGRAWDGVSALHVRGHSYPLNR